MRGKWGWVSALAVIAALIVILAGYKLSGHLTGDDAAAAEPVETVRAVRARVAPFAADSRSIGTVVATETVEIRNELAGTISHVGFRSGEVVPRGALLVRFEAGEERARLAAQRARAAVAAKNLARARSLVDRGFITEAQIDLLMSEAQAARAEGDALAAIIAKKELRAPFAGRAGIHDLHPGQYLAEGALITTMQGIAPERHVDFSLPVDTAAHVALGSVVQMSGTGLPPAGLSARVIARDPSTSDVRLVKYRVSVPASPDRLMPGSFVDVAVPVGQPVPTIFVPRTAVIERPHAANIFVIVPDAQGRPRARQRVVRLGPVVGEEVAILAGVKGGERVAGDGAFKLRDGMLVQPAGAVAAR